MRHPVMLARGRTLRSLPTALFAAAVAAAASRAEAVEGVTVSDPTTVVAGSTNEVSWTAVSGESGFKLKYSLNGGRTFAVARDPSGRKLAKLTGTTAVWRVPKVRGTRRNCVLAVVSYDAAGKRLSVVRTGDVFAVKTVAITSPVAGETLTACENRSVTWECGPTATPVAKVRVSWTADGGTTWTPVADVPGDALGYVWTVPDAADTATSCALRVELRGSRGALLASDESAGEFTIARPSTRDHALDLDAGAGLHVADSQLYWIDVYGDALRRTPADGGDVAVVASLPFAGNNGGLVLDDENFYCWDYGTIWRVSRAEGQVTTFASGRQGCTALCLASGALYARTDTGIERLALDDGASTTLVSFATLLDYQFGYVADGDGLYVADRTSVARVPLGGGTLTTLAAGFDQLDCLVLDAAFLYFSDNGGIHRIATSGGAVTTITPSSSNSLAVAGGKVYFAARESDDFSSIASIPVEGGTVRTLAVGQRWVQEIVPSPARLYWVCGGNRYYPPLGVIRSVPLPCE
jgi:hypothetical protein